MKKRFYLFVILIGEKYILDIFNLNLISYNNLKRIIVLKNNVILEIVPSS